MAEFLATSSWRVRIVPSNHISTICEFCSQNWRTWKTAGTYIHRHSLIFRLDLFPLHRRRWKVLQCSHWVLWYSMQRKQIVQPWEWSCVHECIPPSSAPMPGALVAHEDLILTSQAGSLSRHLLCIARMIKKTVSMTISILCCNGRAPVTQLVKKPASSSQVQTCLHWSSSVEAKLRPP